MKKIFTLTMFALAAMSATAQEYNLFNAADVDADGWLWLNTQEKIDKYVGACDEDNYTVDPNGKIIQMVYANIMPDYPETVADPDVLGTDKAGWVEGQEADGYVADEAIKGAITIAGASAMMSTNGGCLILNLPSCSTISLYLSSEASMLIRSLKLTAGHGIDDDDSTDGNAWTGSTKAISIRATSWTRLHGAGQFSWETAATDNNSNNTGVNFVSDSPVYFCLQNCNRYPIYVHAVKVTTPKQETVGISEVAAGNAAAAPVYNLAGQRIAAPQKGINIIGGKKYCY